MNGYRFPGELTAPSLVDQVARLEAENLSLRATIQRQAETLALCVMPEGDEFGPFTDRDTAAVVEACRAAGLHEVADGLESTRLMICESPL